MRLKSQLLYTVWCYISGEAAGEIWHWSLLEVKGFKELALHMSMLGCNNRPFWSCSDGRTIHSSSLWWKEPCVDVSLGSLYSSYVLVVSTGGVQLSFPGTVQGGWAPRRAAAQHKTQPHLAGSVVSATPRKYAFSLCGHLDFQSAVKARLHVQRKPKHKHKHKPRVNRDDASTSESARSFFLCFCLRRPGSHVAYGCACAYACACVVRVNQPLLHKMTNKAQFS